MALVKQSPNDDERDLFNPVTHVETQYQYKPDYKTDISACPLNTVFNKLDLTTHMIVYGSSGCGKSTFTREYIKFLVRVGALDLRNVQVYLPSMHDTDWINFNKKINVCELPPDDILLKTFKNIKDTSGGEFNLLIFDDCNSHDAVNLGTSKALETIITQGRKYNIHVIIQAHTPKKVNVTVRNNCSCVVMFSTTNFDTITQYAQAFVGGEVNQVNKAFKLLSTIDNVECDKSKQVRTISYINQNSRTIHGVCIRMTPNNMDGIKLDVEVKGIKEDFRSKHDSAEPTLREGDGINVITDIKNENRTHTQVHNNGVMNNSCNTSNLSMSVINNDIRNKVKKANDEFDANRDIDNHRLKYEIIDDINNYHCMNLIQQEELAQKINKHGGYLAETITLSNINKHIDSINRFMTGNYLAKPVRLPRMECVIARQVGHNMGPYYGMLGDIVSGIYESKAPKKMTNHKKITRKNTTSNIDDILRDLKANKYINKNG